MLHLLRWRFRAQDRKCSGSRARRCSNASDGSRRCAPERKAAVARPPMRFVAVKSKEQQALLTINQGCQLIVCQKTQTLNVIRGLLREFGHLIGNGPVTAMHFVKTFQPDDCPSSEFGIIASGVQMRHSGDYESMNWTALRYCDLKKQRHLNGRFTRRLCENPASHLIATLMPWSNGNLLRVPSSVIQTIDLVSIANGNLRAFCL